MLTFMIVWLGTLIYFIYSNTSSPSYIWHIPLTYKTDASNTVYKHLMTSQTGKKDKPPMHECLFVSYLNALFTIMFHLDSVYIGEEVNWVKVNTDMTGYYVVHYADGGWEKMTKLLRENHTALSYQDRTHMIHNAFQLVT